MTNPAHIDPRLLEFNQSDRMDKALRLSGVTGREMADYLGITPSTVSRYINGKADVPLQTLRLWALRTGVPFRWLQTGETPAGPRPDGGEMLPLLDSNQQPFGYTDGDTSPIPWPAVARLPCVA